MERACFNRQLMLLRRGKGWKILLGGTGTEIKTGQLRNFPEVCFHSQGGGAGGGERGVRHISL